MDNNNIKAEDREAQKAAREAMLALARAVKNTPRQYSVNELCGIGGDNEDAEIYERRCNERY